jgi:DNA-binding beta-propeller fold protein YncE
MIMSTSIIGITLTYGSDNNLYVASTGTPGISSILKYDGITGGFLDTFVSAGSGGLKAAFEIIFGPDGNLYVTSLKNYPDEHKILR